MDLFTKKEKEIINFLNTEDKNLPEIAKHLQISKPATSKYLKKLEQQKLIKGTYQKTKSGRTIRYQLQPFHLLCSINPESNTIIYLHSNKPLDEQFPYLGMIPQKSFQNEIKTYLSSLSFSELDTLLILLFGSVAKGTAQRKSDIDLLLIKDSWSKKEQNLILEELAEASINCQHQVKPLFKTKEELKNLNNEFKKEIYTHSIILFTKGNICKELMKKMKRYKNIPN